MNTALGVLVGYAGALTLGAFIGTAWGLVLRAREQRALQRWLRAQTANLDRELVELLEGK